MKACLGATQAKDSLMRCLNGLTRTSVKTISFFLNRAHTENGSRPVSHAGV